MYTSIKTDDKNRQSKERSNIMPKPKKIAISEIVDLSPHPEMTTDTIDLVDPKTSSQYRRSGNMSVENPELVRQKVDFTLNSCQSICMIVMICILVVFVIVLASIALGLMVQDKPQKQTTISQSSKALEVSKEEQELTEQIKRQSDQIFNLNNKIGDLQLQLIKLQAVLEKQNEFHQQKANNINLNNSTQTPQTIQQVPNKPIDKIVINITTQNQNITKNQTDNQSQNEITNQGSSQNQTQTKIQRNETQIIKNETTTKEQKPKFRMRDSPRDNVTVGGPRDLYEFTVSIQNVVDNSPSKHMFPLPNSQWQGLTKADFQRSIRLMEVVHNINFKGQFVFDHYKFYNSPQEKYEALSKVLKQEKQYYDKKYQINKYIHDQIGICVFVPSYNNVNHRLYLRNLDSLFQQQYQNYHLVYVNDASTDGTGDYVKDYMEKNQIPKEKYVIINNEVNQKNCANTFMVIHKYCNAGQIFVMLDGDDALIGRQVFSLLNAIYQKEKIGLTYGQFLLVRNNIISNGFSREIPQQPLQKGTFRQLRSFFSSHLKTMYVDVMRKIKAEDLQYNNGTFYDYAPDVTYMTPSIEMVGPRLKFLKELVYEYRFDTGANEPHQKQIVVEQQVYTKPAYQRLESMPFADEPKTVHYPL